MREINKSIYKSKVLQVLRRVGKPIWLSDLSKKYGLPDVSLHRKGKPRPTQQALRELEASGKIRFLLPRYYKPDSTKPRRKIMLGGKQNPRKYFEVELMDRIAELESQLKQHQSYSLTKHNMNKDVTIKLISFMSNHPYGVTNKQIAKHFKVGVACVSAAPKCNTRIGRALRHLIETDQVVTKKAHNRKGNPLLYRLLDSVQKTEDTPKANDRIAEEELLDALNNFLAIKKSQIMDEVAEDMRQLKQENAELTHKCEQQEKKIGELETKKARGFLNW